MSHEITIGDANVTFEQVEVDLDYGDILDNIEDTINERVSMQISEEAWDAVQYNVEEAAQEAAREVVDETNTDSDHIGDVIWDLLTEYVGIKGRDATPCRIGEAFEKAIGCAVGAGVNDAMTVDDALIGERLAVQKRLADLEHKVNTILAGLFDLGERASAVDDRAV